MEMSSDSAIREGSPVPAPPAETTVRPVTGGTESRAGGAGVSPSWGHHNRPHLVPASSHGTEMPPPHTLSDLQACQNCHPPQGDLTVCPAGRSASLTDRHLLQPPGGNEMYDEKIRISLLMALSRDNYHSADGRSSCCRRELPRCLRGRRHKAWGHPGRWAFGGTLGSAGQGGLRSAAGTRQHPVRALLPALVYDVLLHLGLAGSGTQGKEPSPCGRCSLLPVLVPLPTAHGFWELSKMFFSSASL